MEIPTVHVLEDILFSAGCICNVLSSHTFIVIANLVVLGHVCMHGVCIRVCLIVRVCNIHPSSCMTSCIVPRVVQLLSCHVVSHVEL